MTREEFLKALKALENGTDLVAFYEESETASKEEVGKRNRENQNLRTRLKAAEESATPTKEKLESIMTKLGLDADSDIASAEAAVDKLIAGKGGNESVNALQKRVERLEREKKADADKLKADVASERAKRHDMIRLKDLQDALTANKAAQPGQLAQLLLAKTKVREEDDSVVYVNEKGEYAIEIRIAMAIFLLDLSPDENLIHIFEREALRLYGESGVSILPSR